MLDAGRFSCVDMQLRSGVLPIPAPKRPWPKPRSPIQAWGASGTSSRDVHSTRPMGTLAQAAVRLMSQCRPGCRRAFLAGAGNERCRGGGSKSRYVWGPPVSGGARGLAPPRRFHWHCTVAPGRGSSPHLNPSRQALEAGLPIALPASPGLVASFQDLVAGPSCQS